MQSILDCSFLEVTINSNKLMDILEKLSRQTKENCSEIRVLRDVIPTIKQSVCQSLQATQSRMKFETDRSLLKINEDITALRTALDFQASDNQKSLINIEKKLKDKQTEIQNLQQEKKRIENVINAYEDERLACQSKMMEQIENLKDLIADVNREMRLGDVRHEENLQMMYSKVQMLIKKNNRNSSRRSSRNMGDRMNMPRNSAISRNGDNYLNLATWAKFSNQISSNQRDEECSKQIKIMYPNKVESDESQIQSSSSINESPPPQEIAHLKDISRLYTNLNEENQKVQGVLNNKLTVLEEKTGINTRKLEKVIQAQNQFRLLLKRVEEKKTADQNYETMRCEVKKIQFDLVDELDKRVHKDTYDKDKKKTIDKIAIIQENMTEKAERAEMKRALVFMEEKIKQLIILIASDHGEQKDGAIRKTPAKCLSCDKGLLSSDNTNSNGNNTNNTSNGTSGVNSQPLTSRQGENLTRAVTRKLRTRNQASSQNCTINS